MITDEMIFDLTNGLCEIFTKNVVQIILYGSVARKDYGIDSDIDIAIILDHKIDSNVRERFIEWNSEMDIKYERVFSIVDIEKTQMDIWGNVHPFYKNVKEEGIVLWKKT